jgi:hypothetical protein
MDKILFMRLLRPVILFGCEDRFFLGYLLILFLYKGVLILIDDLILGNEKMPAESHALLQHLPGVNI